MNVNAKHYTRYNGEEDKVYKLAAGLLALLQQFCLSSRYHSPHTLHLTPSTLHPIHYTLHTQPYTLTVDPTLYTPDPTSQLVMNLNPSATSTPQQNLYSGVPTEA